MDLNNKQRTVDDEIAYNNYKLTADKILQLLSQIREDPSASAKRWIWELLQNAKDVPNRFGKVSVEVELISKELLKFRHNGDSFSTKNITGLVQQVSSKDSQNQEGQTGKFGTGFICTHLLSDIIDVEGIVHYMNKDRRFKIQLDRSGYRSEDLLPRIESTLEELRQIETAYEIVENYEENRTEQSFDTVFTYHLTTQEKQNSAVAGLEDLINTLPITLVTQSNKIKQVRIIDRVKGTDVVYKCESKPLGDNVRLSIVKIDDMTKTYLSYITEELALTTEVKCLDNGSYEIIKRDSKHPVLYRDFPLIGSEKFYFPYTLNGFGFNPTERRNGLLLNSADHPNSISNRAIVDKAVEAVISFNDWLISHDVTNRYLLASSRIPKSSEEYSEDVAAPWIKQLQLNWRKQLLEEPLVETENGTEKLKDLSVPCFTNTAVKEVNECFFNLLRDDYIGRGVLPAFKYLHGWLDVIRPEYEAWGTKLKYDKDDFLTDLSDLKNIDTLASKINKTQEETIDWLNKVYKFLIEQNMLNEFDNYAIIPNQKGDFKFLKDLYSDYTSRIPSFLKEVHNHVNYEYKAIQLCLVDERVDAELFGNTLRTYSLKEMIENLNEYIKSGKLFYTGTNYITNYINISRYVAYSILSLYPNTDDEKVLSNRRAIYDFCCDYMSDMNPFQQIDTANEDLWKEADKYWFSHSFDDIVYRKNLQKVSKEFFETEKSIDETLQWLDSYFKFYRDHSYGDTIKEQAVFPNQRLELKKLCELRYDNDIPEPFKDLADHANNSQYTLDVYRHQLIHKSIHGYEQHNPLSTKEIYEFVKKKFDDSNSSTREVIARYAISIIANPENGIAEEKKLYDFAHTLFESSFPDIKYITNGSGFNWGFAQEFYITKICDTIARSVNLDNFKGLSESFKEFSHADLTHWLDSLIEFIHSYKNKKYWSIITDKESGIGIWLNQNGDFCKFQDVREDKDIPEELKDIALNKHVDRDYREELFSLDSTVSSYLETLPMDFSEIGEFIDNKIKEYDGNKQDNDFRSLVFSVGKLCNSIHGLEDYMNYFRETKNSLIVWSLGEGETMELVGSIVQQGDEKLRTVKDILEGNSLEELRNIKDILKGYSIDKVKELINKFTEATPESDGNSDEIEVTIETSPKIYELETTTPNGVQHVKVDNAQYVGLPLEDIKRYVSEAKWAVVKYFKEMKEKLGIQYSFDEERIKMDSYSQLYGIYGPDGKEIPLVVHSYKGPQYRYFDLNWYDWQMLSRPNSMLWVLTVSGLQCIPLYALPVRNINMEIDKSMSMESNTTLLTIGSVGKQLVGDTGKISFEFGNNMPYGFTKPVSFNYVPDEIKHCVSAIKDVCQKEIPSIVGLYNSAQDIKLVQSGLGYAKALDGIKEDVSARELYDLPENNLKAPVIGASFDDLI
jgi:hypothetical protein